MSRVAIIGYGWAGSLMAAELVAQGIEVTVLERGDDLALESCGHFHGYAEGRRPHVRTQNATRETFTLRHNDAEQAVPIRRMGSFLSGSGAGGGGVLWGGLSPRYQPESFTVPQAFRDEIAAREELAPIEMREWPIGYDALEPWYTRFESIAGVAGDSSVTGAQGYRSARYPFPPAPTTEGPEIFRRAALAAGLHPAALPMAEVVRSHTNQFGVTREPCPMYGTTLATPLNTVDPFTRRSGRLTLITGAQVRRIVHDGSRVMRVVYEKDGVESSLEADCYVLAAWTLNNVRLLLLSCIGVPYDPESGTGTVGRFLSNHMTFGAAGFFDGRRIDSSVKTSAGWVVSDYENRAPKGVRGYVGGAQLHCSNLELKPKPDLLVPEGVPRWGLAWKEALRRYARSNVRVMMTGEGVPHRHRFLDLDPAYRDAWGDPLLRLTYDWTINERRLAAAIGAEGRRVLEAAGADIISVQGKLPAHYSTAAYQNSHLAGGAVMGRTPDESVVDTELRCWDLTNLWVVGASAFPRNPSPNPTATLCALALRAANSIISELQSRNSLNTEVTNVNPEIA